MWQEAAEVAIEVFAPMPGPDLDVDRLFDKKNPSLLRVPINEPGALTRRLNESGWFDEEIVAAGTLTQGKAQSLLSLVTGWALVELARGRRSKSLQREFCLAVTADRVIALAMSPWSEGDATDLNVIVKVKREQRGSWPRGSVRIELDPPRKVWSGMEGGTLDLGGERFPVNWTPKSTSTELVELLARG
jgi:hypothetical protein